MERRLLQNALFEAPTAGYSVRSCRLQFLIPLFLAFAWSAFGAVNRADAGYVGGSCLQRTPLSASGEQALWGSSVDPVSMGQDDDTGAGAPYPSGHEAIGLWRLRLSVGLFAVLPESPTGAGGTDSGAGTSLRSTGDTVGVIPAFHIQRPQYAELIRLQKHLLLPSPVVLSLFRPPRAVV